MRVLYNTCIVDPFVKVAKRLWKEYGFEPVYWIGFTDSNTEEIVHRELPGVPFQSYYDAWRGTFNKEIQEKAKTCYVDVDLLNELAHYEVQAYTMMNRMDINRYSFNVMEREQHYLNLLKCWSACLDLYKPDMVISSVVPHRVYDYVLYILCEKRGIKFYIFNNSLSLEWSYITSGIYTIGDLFEKDYRDNLQKAITKDDLPSDVKAKYEQVVKSYEEAAPAYMKRHNEDDVKTRNVFQLFKKNLNKYKSTLFKRAIPVNMYKKADRNWEESRFTALDLYLAKKRQIKYIDALHTYYNSLTTLPQEEDYILVSLHYQPEATSCPAGDMFANQLLIVETLLKNTPDSMKIYVKEHPQQFQAHMNGHSCRTKGFYDSLVRNPRVRLMPLEINSFDLMKQAKAVATITGTVGWEAIMHRKPVIVFGLIWYEGFDGVLRITDSASAEKIMDFIRGYSYDEHSVLSYLKAFVDNSINCYHYNVPRIVKEHVPEEICVDNIVKALSKLS